jgi:hypothetical protein
VSLTAYTMKPLIFGCAFAAVTPVLAQEADPDLFQIPNANRFSVGARIGLNFKGSFSVARSNPGPPTGGVNHNYDDGYVRLDSSGNAGGLTWNWGYDNASQVVGDAIEFHTIDSPALPSSISESSDDAYFGLELVYQRLAGTFMSGGGWGFEAAFTYHEIDIRGGRRGSGAGNFITDRFPLNGVLPPGHPYRGTFEGPGPVIGDTPTRTVTSDGVSFATDNHLQGQMFGFRFGPFIEWNFNRRVSVALSGGLALAPALIDYDFEEEIVTDSGVTDFDRGGGSKTDLLYGNYVGGVVRFQITEQWGVYAGAQYLTLNEWEHTIGNRTAQLDPGSTFYGVAGVTWRF